MTEQAADDLVRQGISAYQNKSYGTAIRHFSNALASSTLGSYTSEDITRMIDKTQSEFRTILNKYPQALATLPQIDTRKEVHNLVVNN